MEHAGIAVKKYALQLGARAKKIVIIAGCGNNGGDALVAARLLRDNDPDVILLEAEARTPLCVTQLQTVRALGINTCLYTKGLLAKYQEQEVFIIDGICGLGLQGAVREKTRDIIAEVNALATATVLAIDIPSGLETDRAATATDALRADATLTFGGLKPVHVLAPGQDWCGKIFLADIGFPPQTVAEIHQKTKPVLHWVEAEKLLTPDPVTVGLPASAHKYERGHVLVIGGSYGKHGAPLLAALAALRNGAGRVSVALDHDASTPPLPLELTYEIFFRTGRVAVPQLAQFVDSSRVKVIVIGPGTVTPVIDRELWQFFLSYSANGGYVVIDAGACNGVLAAGGQAQNRIILTPHPGEWRRLDTVPLPEPDDPASISASKRLATKKGLTLVYKNSRPLVFSASDHVYVCPFGNNNLAKAGSGDVLCGLIASYALTHLELPQAFLTAYAKLATTADKACSDGRGIVPTALLAAL